MSSPALAAEQSATSLGWRVTWQDTEGPALLCRVTDARGRVLAERICWNAGWEDDTSAMEEVEVAAVVEAMKERVSAEA